MAGLPHASASLPMAAPQQTGRAQGAGRPMARVAVVGGGITGLGAAYFLMRRARAAGLALECHLFEADARPGGKVRTLRLPGQRGSLVVELGAESMYLAKPRSIQLARELGLGERLVSQAPGTRTLVFRRGRLHPLPEGLVGVVPSRVGPFLRSSLISWPGKLRMGLELFLPPRRDEADESVANFVARRLGREAVEALADPLLAGIHAADAGRLSLLATYPQLREQERRYGSLLRGMLARRLTGQAERGPGQPLFWSLAEGLDQLIEGLQRALEGVVQLHLGAAVDALEPGPGWRLRLAVRNGKAPDLPEAFDAVILAVPAWEAARLVRSWAPELAEALGGVRYVSVAVVVLVYRSEQVPAGSVVRRTSGLLVGSADRRRAGLCVSACTWFSTKWPHTSPDGRVSVRAFVGRDGEEHLLELDDRELVAAVRRDLAQLAGLAGEPEHAQVFRWVRGVPQYDVGHLERLAHIERLVSGLGGLFVAGAGLRGMSLADCLAQAEQAAEASLTWLGRRGSATGAAKGLPEVPAQAALGAAAQRALGVAAQEALGVAVQGPPVAAHNGADGEV